jgi:hypothetical protein
MRAIVGLLLAETLLAECASAERQTTPITWARVDGKPINSASLAQVHAVCIACQQPTPRQPRLTCPTPGAPSSLRGTIFSRRRHDSAKLVADQRGPPHGNHHDEFFRNY